MTSELPDISIIVTTHNRQEEAKKAIKSALDQSYKSTELIVVEDGTESDIEQWLVNSGYTAVRYIKHPSNRGLAAARNTGIKLASGKFVAFLDDDDVWKPFHLSAKLNYLNAQQNNTNVGLILSGFETRLYNGKILSTSCLDISGNMLNLIQKGFIKTVSSSLLITKTALDKVGGFDENLVSSIDHDMWMNLTRGGFDVITVTDPLVYTYVKVNRKTMMNDPEKRVKGIRQFLAKWEDFLLTNMGQKKGEKFIRNYFAKGVSAYAVTQFENGAYRNWISAYDIIKKYENGVNIDSLLIFSRFTAVSVLKMTGMLKWLKKLRSNR